MPTLIFAIASHIIALLVPAAIQAAANKPTTVKRHKTSAAIHGNAQIIQASCAPLYFCIKG
jgi:hypothetical protein